MGEEAEDGPRVLDWEIGLPTGDDLIPLSQPLVPPELAAAFRIPPADLKTTLELHHAAHLTISSLTRFARKPSPSQDGDDDDDDRPVIPLPDPSTDEISDRALKRPRLLWTPQLHWRFVDVVAHLGVKNAAPKTITQMMNVEGLTRENVASHLQKYRLYHKRMQGSTSEASSSFDHPLASTPLPQEQQMPVPMIPMPIYSMPNQHAYAMPFVGFDDRYPHEQNNWLSGSKFGSYPHVFYNDK